jgi:hypothetical protein
MKLTHLTAKQQLAWAIAITVIILSIYGFTRFYPEVKEINAIEFSAQKTQRKILKNRLQDEPTEDLAKLLEKIEDQEQAMALIKANAEDILTRLAAFDSQELKVRISQLANKSRVRIKNNEAVNTFPTNVLNNQKLKKKKNKGNAALTFPEQALLPASRGWVARLSPGTMLHRPLQKIQLEGTYQSIQQFIFGLDALPWQVTVIQLQMQKMPTDSPVGYAQLLSADLILAL